MHVILQKSLLAKNRQNVLIDLGITGAYSLSTGRNSKKKRRIYDMLNEKEIKLVVTSAMAKYASENDGKDGISKADIITIMLEHDGNLDDVRVAMAEGISRLMMKANIKIKMS